MELFLLILVLVILIAGCIFVNDTKKKHGTCCGKGCAGCPVFEKEHQKKQSENKDNQTQNDTDENTPSSL